MTRVNTDAVTHAFTMSEGQARAIHQLVDGHCKALKNWIVSAVERGDLDRAQRLTAELRDHEALYAAFNMKAKREVASFKAVPMETVHEC